jgi:hypothetical protein
VVSSASDEQRRRALEPCQRATCALSVWPVALLAISMYTEPSARLGPPTPSSLPQQKPQVGMEPEPMGGVFERAGGATQSTLAVLDHRPRDYASLVRELGGPFDLVYSIEVQMGHSPCAPSPLRPCLNLDVAGGLKHTAGGVWLLHLLFSKVVEPWPDLT